ncbi:Dam family site-specific DNA-(adenine-N6)-methyltransferase [Ruminococcus sp.]|uniref:DNA adenine methylase n=1 Tax=Ruminococcus sp. TaxID=41978 RepID=UPI0025F22BED|nr:Dam family site-specific DNA-(adenine-N6)-methyltransferase [Ruminococcus sp.]MBR1432576.1 Dam family site-specific DNA-(adenine-N6)-methyltransferase [Ruminococcus sp.]
MKTQVKEKTSRSPFFYVGDKYKLVPQLKSHFPDDIENFIEPFCGGGSVFLNVDAEKYIINDIDAYMIALHKMLGAYSTSIDDFWSDLNDIIEEYDLSASFLGRTVPEEYKIKYVKTYYAKYNKSSYMKLRDDFNDDKNDLLKLYILLIYGFNRMLRFNGNGDFNLPVGNVDFNQNVVNALNNYFDFVSERKISYFSLDFEDFLSKIKISSDDFIYLDPPYLISFSEYNKLWNEQEEIRLLSCLDDLNSRNIRFAVSNIIKHKNMYNELFDKWAKKYNVIDITSNYISFHDNTQKGSYEVLVTNY